MLRFACVLNTINNFPYICFKKGIFIKKGGIVMRVFFPVISALALLTIILPLNEASAQRGGRSKGTAEPREIMWVYKTREAQNAVDRIEEITKNLNPGKPNFASQLQEMNRLKGLLKGPRKGVFIPVNASKCQRDEIRHMTRNRLYHREPGWGYEASCRGCACNLKLAKPPDDLTREFGRVGSGSTKGSGLPGARPKTFGQ
jgi:hypothetical protein